MGQKYNNYVFRSVKTARDLALFLQDEAHFNNDGKFNQKLTFEGIIDSSHIRTISLELIKDRDNKEYETTKIGCFSLSYLKEMINLFDGLGASEIHISSLISEKKNIPIIFQADTHPALYYTLAPRVEDDEDDDDE